MSIRTNIQKVIDEIQKPENAELGDELQKKAILAIKGGEGSPPWKEYMQMFAENDEQLARLMPTDNTKDDFEMDLARTYLIGNGPCGALTVTRLLFGVEDTLDEGLSS